MSVPFTVTRLSQSLSLIGVHQTGDSGLPFDLNKNDLNDLVNNPLSSALNLADFAASIKTIGATWSFKVSQSRQNYERRGMNSPMEPFAIVPGPQTTSIEMDRAVLYLQDAMAAFGFLPGNIAHQTRPLIIMESVQLPQNPDGSTPKRLQEHVMANLGKGLKFSLEEASPIIYLGCWIKQSEINYDLKSNDQMVVQHLTFDVARVMQPLSLVPFVGEELQGTLAENFSVARTLGL